MKSTIEFEHGERTCSSAPGKFCRWNWTRKFGTVPVCALFDCELFADDRDWIERCQACKTAYPVPVQDAKP
jgi:hypothetical protein